MDQGKNRTHNALRKRFAERKQAVLLLEDGTAYQGYAIGKTGSSSGEIIFNTAMMGYQEIISDPSYAEQIICFSYPHIGNVGANTEDFESSKTWVRGVVMHATPTDPSNWRSELSFVHFLEQQGIVGITGINTRKLIQQIRNKGAVRACIAAHANEAEHILQNTAAMDGSDLASIVSTSEPYVWTEGSWWKGKYQRYTDAHFHKKVVVYDFGVKHSILRALVDEGCRVTVLPAHSSVEDVALMNPDGIVLSNGPGDPRACKAIIKIIQGLCGLQIPILGICLGHQLLALANGATIYKMKFGHHGANHPVINLENNSVQISSQNHGYAVDHHNLPSTLYPTAFSLFDNSLQGLAHHSLPCISVQGHPEAGPGPQDLRFLFNDFFTLMKRKKNARKN